MDEINKIIEEGLNGLIDMIEAYRNGNEASREIINQAEHGG